MYGGSNNHQVRPLYEFRTKGAVHGHNTPTTGLKPQARPSMEHTSNAQSQGQTSLRLVFSF